MLKVGDKVKVRKGLENVTTFVMVKEDMVKLEGKEVEISWVGANHTDGITRYRVKEDLGGWYWTEKMFEKIEEKESDNMKELTFREVIANIKEGEVWEGREYTIALLGNRIAINYNDGDEYNGVYPLIEGTFKLKRPQYTFQEAFKAFEEGKEKESCESGDIYKGKEEYRDYHLLSLGEIRGQWYIND